MPAAAHSTSVVDLLDDVGNLLHPPVGSSAWPAPTGRPGTWGYAAVSISLQAWKRGLDVRRTGLLLSARLLGLQGGVGRIGCAWMARKGG